MNITEIKETLGNKIFSAKFVKKDGSIRDIHCRLNVKKYLKGGSKRYDTDSYNYLTVYDLKKKAYRTINLNNLIEIKAKGFIFRPQRGK
jgi:hypothetical protein